MPITIDLPHPHKVLWPNGSRTNNRKWLASEKNKAKQLAAWATLTEAKQHPVLLDDSIPHSIPVRLEVHAKPKGPLPDIDNVIASCKAYFDGIAEQLKINDRAFARPDVVFTGPRDSRFVITIG